MNLEAAIKEQAHRLGFDLVGITTAEPFPDADAAYQRWIDAGAHAGMDYMAEHRDRVGDDYHLVMWPRLRTLCEFLASRGARLAHYYVDTGPVLDRAIAQRAGLGWCGRHSCLITRSFGTWVVLGEIHRFRRSVVKRAKRSGLRRNVAVAWEIWAILAPCPN